MNYKFPLIRTIDDVAGTIIDAREFIIADREHFDVVNYMVSTPTTFPEVNNVNDAIRRECRGLVFDKNGYIIARRLHKFFNCGEKDETQLDRIDLSKPHVILEKLDGSMITPITFTNKHGTWTRWGTKMGITDVAMNAEEFVDKNPTYEDFAWLCYERSQTPIFEWCSRKNRIVVDYPEDRLVLIAVRHNETGEYWSYDQMRTYAESYKLDLVKMFPGTIASMENLISEIGEKEGEEGVVIRFDDGHMLKVKSSWYIRIHKTKDNLNFEKNILDLILSGKIDDAKAFMLEDDRKRVEDFEAKFWFGVENKAAEIAKALGFYHAKCAGDRKTFALQYAPSLDSYVRSILFKIWDGIPTTVMDELVGLLSRNVSSQNKVDAVRHLWGGHKWNYHNEEE